MANHMTHTKILRNSWGPSRRILELAQKTDLNRVLISSLPQTASRLVFSGLYFSFVDTVLPSGITGFPPVVRGSYSMKYIDFGEDKRKVSCLHVGKQHMALTANTQTLISRFKVQCINHKTWMPTHSTLEHRLVITMHQAFPK